MLKAVEMFNLQTGSTHLWAALFFLLFPSWIQNQKEKLSWRNVLIAPSLFQQHVCSDRLNTGEKSKTSLKHFWVFLQKKHEKKSTQAVKLDVHRKEETWHKYKTNGGNKHLALMWWLHSLRRCASLLVQKWVWSPQPPHHGSSHH